MKYRKGVINMRTRSTILLPYLLTLLFASTLQAHWVQTSLDSVSVTCFAASDTNLFARTSGGLFHSSDNGSSWDSNGLKVRWNYIVELTIMGTNLLDQD